MNNKKIQAQMQIDVSFVGKTTNLVKDLQSGIKSLDLSSALTKNIGSNLNKSFKDIYANLDRMSEGLSKKGLSPKQYSIFFDTINAKVNETAQIFGNLKKTLSDVYNSEENKKAIKDLTTLKKELEGINKVVTNQKKLQTRQGTAKTKIKDLTGYDYDAIKGELRKIINRQGTGKDLTSGQEKWLYQDLKLSKEEAAEVLKLFKQIDTLRQKESDNAKEFGSDPFKTKIETEKKIAQLEKTAYTADAHKHNLSVFKQEEQALQDVYNISDTLLNHWNSEVPRATQEARELAEAQSTIKEIFAQFGITFSAATLVRGFQDLVREAFNFYKALDSALNEIYVVSNLTINEVNKLQTSFVDMAKTTGMSIDDITRSATLFFQQGLNTEEAMTMTKVTSEFAKVAGIDATSAADKLTAAVNGYCLAAEDAARVADKFNKVAAASAADIDELSTAFSKAAAQANQAGVGMDNYLAYIATMVEATREAPENIGTSLKTIMSRMQQVKMSGTTEDGETDVNQVETALKSVGVALRDAQGELRNLEDVFAELGPKWQSLDRNTQAYLGTIIAGTRQQSRFITLMQNWDRVLDLADQSANSAGMQSLMHAKAMESVESKLQQLNVAWQEFVSNLTDSGSIKIVIELLTKLVDALNDGTKPLMLLSGIVGLLGPKIAKLNKPLGNMVKHMKDGIKGVAASVKGVVTKKGVQDNPAYFTSEAEKNFAMADIKMQVEANRQLQTRMQMRYDELKLQGNTIENNQEMVELERMINDAKEDGIKLSAKQMEISNKEVMTKKQAMQNAIMAFEVAAQSISMMLSEVDEAAAGTVSGVSGILAGIGKIGTQDYVGGTISVIMGVIQLVETFKDWDEKMANKLSDAANNINQAATELSNTKTQINSTNELLDRYDELQNKIYRTAAEQEELNNIAQQMADSFDSVEAITDAYGNLTINVANARQELANLQEQYNEQFDDLNKTEKDSVLEATSGLGNTNTLTEAYEKVWSTNRGTYRGMLKGVKDGLTDESRNVSKAVAQEFSENLKDAITNEVEHNSLKYGHKGLLSSMVDLEEGVTGDLESEDWNELYNQINILEQNMGDMTFAQVQESLDNFYNSWSGKNQTTLEEWQLLKDTINGTLYDNSSLLQFYKTTEETMNKLTDDDSKDILKAMGNVIKEGAEFKLTQAGYMAGGAAIGAGVGAAGGAIAGAVGGAGVGAVPGAIAGAKIGAGVGAGAGFIASYFSKDAKEYRLAKKELQEIIKENEETLKQIMESNKNLKTEEDAVKWVYAQNQVAEALKNTTQETQNYLSGLESLYDMSGLDAEQAAQFSTDLQSALGQIELGGTDAEKYNYLSKWYEENKDTMTEEMREHWQGILDDAFDGLKITGRMTFTQIGNELKSISTDLQSINKLTADFTKNGGMALDSFIELAGILDDISAGIGDLGQLPDGAKYVDEYIDAIDQLNLAYDANTGYITMNGESLQTLQKIQEIQTKAKIAGMIADLKASRATTETELAYIDAQIAATDAAIEMLGAEAGTKVTQSQLMSQADAEYMNVFDSKMADITEGYKNDVTNNSEWATTILNNIGAVSAGWNKYFTGIRDGSEIPLDEIYGKADTVLDGKDHKWEASYGTSGIDWKSYSGTLTTGSKEANRLKAELEEYRTKLVNTRKEYQATLDTTNAQIKMLEGMMGMDLSKLGLDGAVEELDKYIGKLKEIYNILNRIQNLEHRLSTLDTYSEIAVGANYGKYYQERLKYTEELSDQYKFLVTEQKKFANGYMEFIENSAVADVFDFDEFGQIIINFEKYNALQDTAADGEKSLKEQADELYETYTEMYGDLQGYFDDYISYLQKAIDLHQEAIDAYVETENKVADAIKEIYQKILDTKLEAIDKEKEAIEELRQAREDARKDKENAEAVSGLQTNLQRAMMDTSGASDISLIKAQKDMNDKLEDIAEDKYSEMLDDIIARLEDEQEALQDNFDQMFENTEWLFSFIEENIMNDQAKIEEILTQTDDWLQKSNLERKMDMEQLSTDFSTYMAAMRGGEGEGSTIYDVWDRLGDLKNATQALDEALKTREVNVGTAVANAVAEGVKVAAAAYTSGGGGNLNNNNNNNDENKNDKPTYNDNYNPAKVTAPTWKVYFSNGAITTKEGKVGESCPLPTAETRKGYIFKGWSLDGAKATTTPFKPTKGEHHAMGVYEHYTQIDTSKTPTTTPTTTDPFPLVTGPTLKLPGHAKGGMLRETGPIWVDGTYSNPEAVLTALQTKHFINFAESLDKMYSNHQMAMDFAGGSVNIGSIEFNVESMSSVEDGERAFTMFVDKFKEIGDRTGIRINTFKNTL